MSNNDVMEICMGLKRAFKDLLVWGWDGRFETVLAEFSVSDMEQVREELARSLPFVWDRENIGEAPVNIQMLNNHLGGLMPGQMIFASDPDQDEFLFGAWWPWGNGQTISIRMAPIYTNLSGAENAERTEQLKEWFGV